MIGCDLVHKLWHVATGKGFLRHGRGSFGNTPIFNISLLILLLDNISINVIISIGF